MKKIIYTLVVSLLLTLLLTTTIYAQTSEQSEEPKLMVESINIKTMNVGETYDIEIILANTSNYAAKDLNLLLTADTNSPFQVLTTNPKKYIKYLNPNKTTTLNYTIKVAPIDDDGVYTLSLTGSYINSSSEQFSINEPINILVEVSKFKSSISVSLKNQDLEVEAGSNFTADLYIRNNAMTIPKDVEITLTNLSSNTIVNTSANKQSFDYLHQIAGINTSFDLYASSNLSEGVYPLGVNISYIDDNEQHVDEDFEVFVKVLETKQSSIVVKNINKSTENVGPKETFTISYDIVNEGTGTADDIKVTLDHAIDIVPITQSIFIIDHLASGETKNLTFELEATDNVTTKNYPISITVESNGSNGNESTSQYTGIYITNDEEDEEVDASIPRIIINKFTTGKDKIFVGDEFNFDFSVKNTSLIKNINNLKIVVDVNNGSNNSDTAFLPINQSNSIFVGNLDTDEIIDLNIPMKVIANAEGKIYSLNISFEYEDEDGVKYTDSEVVNIPVYQDAKLTISDVRMGKQLDNSYTLEVDFYNTGKVDISNLMVDIEGDFNTLNSNYYVGDFATGRTDIYDVQIQGAMPSTIEGKILFTYDDTFGEQVTVTKEFNLGNTNKTNSKVQGSTGKGAVPAMANGNFDGMSRDEIRAKMQNGELNPENLGNMKNKQNEESNIQLSTIIPIGVVVLIGITIAIVIIRKRKKKGDL